MSSRQYTPGTRASLGKKKEKEEQIGQSLKVSSLWRHVTAQQRLFQLRNWANIYDTFLPLLRMRIRGSTRRAQSVEVPIRVI